MIVLVWSCYLSSSCKHCHSLEYAFTEMNHITEKHWKAEKKSLRGSHTVFCQQRKLLIKRFNLSALYLPVDFSWYLFCFLSIISCCMWRFILCVPISHFFQAGIFLNPVPVGSKANLSSKDIVWFHLLLLLTYHRDTCHGTSLCQATVASSKKSKQNVTIMSPRETQHPCAVHRSCRGII